jgi:hypothetical protein
VSSRPGHATSDNNDYGNSHNVPTKKIGVENGKQIKLNIIKSKNTTKNLIQ